MPNPDPLPSMQEEAKRVSSLPVVAGTILGAPIAAVASVAHSLQSLAKKAERRGGGGGGGRNNTAPPVPDKEEFYRSWSMSTFGTGNGQGAMDLNSMNPNGSLQPATNNSAHHNTWGCQRRCCMHGSQCPSQVDHDTRSPAVQPSQSFCSQDATAGSRDTPPLPSTDTLPSLINTGSSNSTQLSLTSLAAMAGTGTSPNGTQAGSPTQPKPQAPAFIRGEVEIIPGSVIIEEYLEMAPIARQRPRSGSSKTIRPQSHLPIQINVPPPPPVPARPVLQVQLPNIQNSNLRRQEDSTAEFPTPASSLMSVRELIDREHQRAIEIENQRAERASPPSYSEIARERELTGETVRPVQRVITDISLASPPQPRAPPPTPASGVFQTLPTVQQVPVNVAELSPSPFVDSANPHPGPGQVKRVKAPKSISAQATAGFDSDSDDTPLTLGYGHQKGVELWRERVDREADVNVKFVCRGGKEVWGRYADLAVACVYFPTPPSAPTQAYPQVIATEVSRSIMTKFISLSVQAQPSKSESKNRTKDSSAQLRASGHLHSGINTNQNHVSAPSPNSRIPRNPRDAGNKITSPTPVNLQNCTHVEIAILYHLSNLYGAKSLLPILQAERVVRANESPVEIKQLEGRGVDIDWVEMADEVIRSWEGIPWPTVSGSSDAEANEDGEFGLSMPTPVQSGNVVQGVERFASSGNLEDLINLGDSEVIEIGEAGNMNGNLNGVMSPAWTAASSPTLVGSRQMSLPLALNALSTNVRTGRTTPTPTPSPIPRTRISASSGEIRRQPRSQPRPPIQPRAQTQLSTLGQPQAQRPRERTGPAAGEGRTRLAAYRPSIQGSPRNWESRVETTNPGGIFYYSSSTSLPQ